MPGGMHYHREGMPDLWRDDAELFSLIRRELFTAVVGDAMDKCKLRRQFLPPQIQPLVREMVVVGRAMTVLAADVFEESSDQPFGLMMEALDDLKPGEVYVCAGCSPSYALWGELMSIRALKRGAAGAVVNGYLRDTRGILALGFPAFSWGSYAQDQAPRGKVIDFRVPVEMNHTRVEPGDIVFGDTDGVCIVPAEWEKEVFMLAFEKSRKEKSAKRDLEAGVSAVEVFRKHGIL